MMRRLRQILPRPRYIVLAAFLYGLSFSGIVVSFLLLGVSMIGRETPEDLRFRIGILAVIASAYALYRVLCFHPIFRPAYRRWLALSPWKSPKPLPLGPVGLTWVDCLVVALLTLLAWAAYPSLVLVPVIVFLASYVAVLAVALALLEEWLIPTICLAAAPLAFYPLGDLVVAVLVLGGACLLCWAGLRRTLKRFPWNSPDWKSEPLEALRRNFQVSGWPYSSLLGGLDASPRFWSRSKTLILCVLATWWVHVLTSLAPNPEEVQEIREALLLTVALVASGMRILLYLAVGWPPISLWGRLLTFRWIIPRYDYLFVAPIYALLSGLLAMHLLGGLGVPFVLAWDLSFLIVLLCVGLLPPSLKRWRLTGGHRIPRLTAQSGMAHRSGQAPWDLRKFAPGTRTA